MNPSTLALVLLCISLAIPQAGHSLLNAAESTGQVSAVAASTAVQQWVEHGRAWLAKNKYAEAIQCFDKAAASATDPAASLEPRRLSTEAHAAWLQSLQMTRYQVSGQVASAKEKLGQIEQEVAQAKQALADLATQQKQAISSHGKIRVDSIAQANRNTHELKILSGATAINNQTKLIATLNQQLNSLEVQINSVLASMPTPTILRITQARYGQKDVTGAVQELAHGDRATICASAKTFGLQQEQPPDATLNISYELRGEKKEISVPQGWTVKLPSAQLISPPLSTADPPWYEQNAMWLVGGVVALLLVVTTFWQPKPKEPDKKWWNDDDNKTL
ncbi:MAG: hypothetical protein NT105_11045 [Verrucomicrobia bacterium]|nr:hypothetical protein [Verrucomicrobiota bacterium]